jgi:hypothetical protein
MNISSDTLALSSHFLDQACVRNLLKNPSRIIYYLKYNSVGFVSSQFNRIFVLMFR